MNKSVTKLKDFVVKNENISSSKYSIQNILHFLFLLVDSSHSEFHFLTKMSSSFIKRGVRFQLKNQ